MLKLFKNMCFNFEEVFFEIYVENGGFFISFVVKEVEFICNLLKFDLNVMFGLLFCVGDLGV